MILIGKK
jgi:hypothetical protein